MTTMEDLTKTQIVLLTLLVSFVTSIATGIITSTLLAQAPPNVTQTIDRVVERTVERVVPDSNNTIKEVTVVKEEDAVISAIEKNTKAIVRVTSQVNEEKFYALGVVVSKQGLILTDRHTYNANGGYTVTFSDGSTLPANIVASSDTGGFVLLRLSTDEAHLKALIPVSISQTDAKLGQTVIAIQGKDKTSVSVGRAVSADANAGLTVTDIATGEIAGSSLLNLSGELVGLKTSNGDLSISPSVYTNASALAKFIPTHP